MARDAKYHLVLTIHSTFTAKQTAWQTVVKIVTTGFVLALVAGALIKLKLFGGGL